MNPGPDSQHGPGTRSAFGMGGYVANDEHGAGPNIHWVRPCMGTEMNFHEHMNFGGFNGWMLKAPDYILPQIQFHKEEG
jgi:hypothetical protein